MDKTSEEYRRLCEARMYLSMVPHLQSYHINRVTHFRGDTAAQRLLEDVAELRQKEKK
jgi:hypothetical protein